MHDGPDAGFSIELDTGRLLVVHVSSVSVVKLLGLFCKEEDSKPPNIHFPFFRNRSNSKSRRTLTPARTNAAHDIYLRRVELGLEKERILYTRVGIPVYDLNLLIHNPSEYTSNANLMRNPETIAKLVHYQVRGTDLQECL